MVTVTEEYWPNGPGKVQLDKFAGGSTKQKRSPTTNTLALAKRADRAPEEVLEYDDPDYPYPYNIDDIYKWYGDVTW
jgi:hypothetical protein